MSDLVQLLAPFDVFFVGVHCPLPELERREHRGVPANGGRCRLTVNRFAQFDLTLIRPSRTRATLRG